MKIKYDIKSNLPGIFMALSMALVALPAAVSVYEGSAFRGTHDQAFNKTLRFLSRKFKQRTFEEKKSGYKFAPRRIIHLNPEDSL